MAGVYDRYTRYRRDCAIVGEVLPYAQFKKQLEHYAILVQKNKSKRLGDEVKKVWVIGFPAISRHCDVSGFLRGEAAADPQQEALPV